MATSDGDNNELARVDEVDAYLALQAADWNINVTQWWRGHQQHFLFLNGSLGNFWHVRRLMLLLNVFSAHPVSLFQT